MAASGRPILYSYFRSSCSWRVRAALVFKNIDYEYRAVDIVKEDGGEQFSQEFAKLNPLKEVPVLVDRGNVFTHSVPIIEYLEETRPRPSLLPSDPVQRARVRGLVETVASGIQPMQNLRVLTRVGGDSREWPRQFVEYGFDALEKQLANTCGTCCVGDSITIADLCLVPQVYAAQLRFRMDIKNYPTMFRINEYLCSQEVFKRSHPHKQPDCPEKPAQKT